MAIKQPAPSAPSSSISPLTTGAGLAVAGVLAGAMVRALAEPHASPNAPTVSRLATRASPRSRLDRAISPTTSLTAHRIPSLLLRRAR